MYLEKLEIQGFKSFANKNLLVFPGLLDNTRRGLTAIVGPNGSGKSNVADAVRWVLGEQSMKTLRGKKSEDVIFSGSDKKGKLGMAEVSLHLNNEDRQAPIDYSELVITRRLFRDGESEYILNGSRVRLSDIQILLAKSKFGQKTYSVIGQGMVEGFLNTSLAERKEFFDEATGVKQYQIKRDESLNKLRLSHENLAQARMLAAEIEPRLKSLTRQVNRLKRRDETEAELRAAQTGYYRALWQELNGKFTESNRALLEQEQGKFQKDKKLEALERELEALKTEDRGNEAYAKLEAELAEAQRAKDALTARAYKLEAQLEAKLEAGGNFDLSFLMKKQGEIAAELEDFAREAKRLVDEQAADRDRRSLLEREKAAGEEEARRLNLEMEELDKERSDGEHISRRLRALIGRLDEAHGHDDLARIKALIQEIQAELRELTDLARGQGGPDKAAWARLRQGITETMEAKERVLHELSAVNARLATREERLGFIRQREAAQGREQEAIAAKLKRHDPGFDRSGLDAEAASLKAGIAEAEAAVAAAKQRLSDLNRQGEAARAKLFALQREYAAAQNEINALSNGLNEIKVNSARYEAKLEDLEAEVRQELGGLKEVKEGAVDDGYDPAADRERIQALKRQLDLIGGIDPEVEKEYNETKERYDFLSSQIDDFTQTMDSLAKVIKELDATIKEQFDQEFKVIEENFGKYFKILFNGGSARIIKVMEADDNDSPLEGGDSPLEGGAHPAPGAAGEDSPLEGGGRRPGDDNAKNNEDQADLKRIKYLQKHNATGLAGIEIQATPPGKKIKSVAMLSGGERALTAIALICAIINSNPSPFVVLDEVDAALDEANSERLAKILDELSHRTQFIVITHNRASMRRAAILYGVTMGDDGVSKLLSVKLEEAAKV